MRTCRRQKCIRSHCMKHVSEFVVRSFVAGVVILLPVYFSLLLLLKAMRAVAEIVKPLAKLVPKWFPAENVLSLLFVLMVCFLVGVAVRTRAGRAVRERMEKS